MILKRIIIPIIALLLFFPVWAEAQQWMVYLKDKQHDGFNPYVYFDAKAINRRIRNGLAIDEPTDWPVSDKYIRIITPMVSDVIMTTRWFNAVAVDADENQIEVVRNLPFVLDVEQIEPLTAQITAVAKYDTLIDEDEARLLSDQLNTLGVDVWKTAGIDGSGIRIAIFDVGFLHADQVPAFDHIRAENRLIATRDFSDRRNPENVYYGNAHGTEVWSCIAGKTDGKQIGLATGAEFLLAKTEKNSEKYSEELNWLSAVEWADQKGADIINSSLGYTGKRYFNWQMDGQTSLVSRAANIAARKGILVVTAAGNEGDSPWHYIAAPADADSALTIGGIDPATGFHTGFSSYGPTTDKRMKPNVVAYGHVIAAGPSGFTSTQGTSFASPLIAGFAACAWQADSTLTNMQLFHEIEKSGNLYPYFDYAHGFGIPQAAYFVSKVHGNEIPTFRIIETGDTIHVVISNFNVTGSASVLPENAETIKRTNSDGSEDYFYYNIMDKAGVLDRYYVLEVTQSEVLNLCRTGFEKDESLNLHYKGYSFSIKL